MSGVTSTGKKYIQNSEPYRVIRRTLGKYLNLGNITLRRLGLKPKKRTILLSHISFNDDDNDRAFYERLCQNWTILGIILLFSLCSLYYRLFIICWNEKCEDKILSVRVSLFYKLRILEIFFHDKYISNIILTNASERSKFRLRFKANRTLLRQFFDWN